MSDLQKRHGILHGNDSGGYCYVSEKVSDSDMHDRLTRKVITDDGILVHEAIMDAEALMKNSIVQSRQLVDRAENESQTMIAKAKKQGFSKGYDEGYSQGCSEGVQLSIAEKQPLVEELSQLSQKLSEHYGQPKDKYEYLDSALELAKRIISIELSKNDDAYFGLYRKAALHISNVDKATLKAGPRGCAVVKANKSKFEGAIEGLHELDTKLAGDDDGLCMLETPLGNINASVSAQLSRVKKIISPQE